ncbi:MAG: ArsR/SmtB family transcription factor [Alphaproteobacteria bacterium]
MADGPEDDHLDRVFHALANRTRRALLARLALGPSKVTELAAPFAMSLPSVSKHLRVLEGAGLIDRSIDGRIHRCCLMTAPLDDVAAWLAHYRTFWDNRLAVLARHVEGEPR